MVVTVILAFFVQRINEETKVERKSLLREDESPSVADCYRALPVPTSELVRHVYIDKLRNLG